MITLKPWQSEPVERLVESISSHRVGVDASDAGTGKTYVGSEVAHRLQANVLVVCPKVIRPVWSDTLTLAGVPQFAVVNYEWLRMGREGFGVWKGRQFNWQLPLDTLIIWDEAHKAKSPKSQIAKMVKAAKPYRNLLMSATLAESPMDMRALGYLTGMHMWDNWYNWCMKLGCRKDMWGGLYMPKTARTMMTKLHGELFPKFGVRVRIKDLGDMFPSTVVTAEALSFEMNIQAEYNTALEKIRDENESPLAAYTAARLMSERLKIPELISMTKDAVEEGRSVAVFFNFREPLNEFAELMTCPVVQGGQSEDERNLAIEQFQSGESRVIAVNIQAGGVGLSLHDVMGNSPRTALICPTGNAKDLKQVLGRVHRAGGTPSIQRIIFAAGTIEERVCKRVQQKLDNIELLNDGDLSLNEIETPLSNTAMTEQPTVRGHAKHSPSSLPYKLGCSGWLSNNDPNRDMSAAERGTRGHEAWELGNTSSVADDPALAKAVQMCIDYTSRFKGEVWREQKIAVLDQFGYFDCLIVDGGTAYLLDAKFAHNLYRADSPQFWAYVVGIWDDPRWMHLNRIEVHVLHPWLDTIDIHVFNRCDYDRLRDAVSKIIEAAKVADPSTFTITPNCTYCGRIGKCPKVAEELSALATRYAKQELTIPAESHGSEIKDPEVLAKLLKLAPIVDAASSGWRKAALDMWQQDGVPIPGFKLLEREGARKITAPKVAYDLFIAKGGDPAQFAEVVKLPIGEFETLYASLAPRGKKGAAKQELNDLLQDREAITLGQNSFYLVENKQHGSIVQSKS